MLIKGATGYKPYLNYLNQYWLINCTLRKTLQWNLHQNSKLSFEGNTVHWKCLLQNVSYFIEAAMNLNLNTKRNATLLHTTRGIKIMQFYTTRVTSRLCWKAVISPVKTDLSSIKKKCIFCGQVWHLFNYLLFWIMLTLENPLTLNMRWTELSRFNWVNIMVVDALAPCVARTSTPMILTV